MWSLPKRTLNRCISPTPRPQGGGTPVGLPRQAAGGCAAPRTGPAVQLDRATALVWPLLRPGLRLQCNGDLPPAGLAILWRPGAPPAGHRCAGAGPAAAAPGAPPGGDRGAHALPARLTHARHRLPVWHEVRLPRLLCILHHWCARQGCSRLDVGVCPAEAVPFVPPCCPCRSYYAIVSLSVLPPAAYPVLFQRAAQLPAVLAGRRPALPRLGWVLSNVSTLQLAGAALFLAGNALQCHSHWLLAQLGGKAKRRGPTYKIPRGAHERSLVAKDGRWVWRIMKGTQSLSSHLRCTETTGQPVYHPPLSLSRVSHCPWATADVQAAPLSWCPARTTWGRWSSMRGWRWRWQGSASPHGSCCSGW